MPGRRHLAVVWTPARTLRQLAAGDPRALRAATLTIGRRLAAAHRRGAIHGRFSPDHALLDADGAVWLRDRPELLDAARRCAAPEVLRGRAADATADQYSFAAAVVEVWPPALLRVPGVRAALLRALAVAPSERWPSLDALLRALGRERRRWRLIAALLWLIVALAVASRAA